MGSLGGLFCGDIVIVFVGLGHLMIENIKAVNNPLTIIAIFAALAEIAGTVAIKLVNPELQYIFIWFVMLFPVLIVILFFLTLNFNPKVLYAPSDFRDEGNFLNVVGAKRLSVNLEEVTSQLENAKVQIAEDVVKRIGANTEQDRKILQEILDNSLQAIQIKVEDTKESAQAVNGLPRVNTSTRILEILADAQDKGMQKEDLHEKLSHYPSFYRRLKELTNMDYIVLKDGKFYITHRGNIKLKVPE